MNPVKNALSATKNFVADHKTPLTIIATAGITVAVMRKVQGAGLKEAYDFIEAKGLTTDFVNNTI